MNRERSNWLAIGLLLTGLVSVTMGVVTLSGFGGAPGGDLLISSTSGSTNLALAVGALSLLGVEFAHMRRRPARARRAVRTPLALKA